MSATPPRPSGPRPVRAPRGPTRTCRTWQAEAALRMLMNNLDPEVAEDPDRLIVYGGRGQAARSWAAFDAIVAALRALGPDETLLVQSGKPVGVLRTFEDAPRVLIANSNLVPHWATQEHFDELARRGLMMFGQMTAGSWIYIGTQGILQGTYETFAECARQHFGGSLAGRWVVTAGCGGMGGAQPLAVTMNGGVCLIADVDADKLRRRAALAMLDEIAPDVDAAIDQARAHAAARRGVSVGVAANAVDLLERLVARGVVPDALTDQTPAHDVASYVPAALALAEARALAASDPVAYAERSLDTMARHVRALLALMRRGAITFDTATTSASAPASAASPTPSPSRASSPPTSARSSASGAGRSAGPRCRARPRTSSPSTARSSSCSRTTSRSGAGWRWPATR